MRYHWIRDALNAKLLKLVKIHTDDNDADMMTKALPRGKKGLWWSESEKEDREIEREGESFAIKKKIINWKKIL